MTVGPRIKTLSESQVQCNRFRNSGTPFSQTPVTGVKKVETERERRTVKRKSCQGLLHSLTLKWKYWFYVRIRNQMFTLGNPLLFSLHFQENFFRESEAQILRGPTYLPVVTVSTKI